MIQVTKRNLREIVVWLRNGILTVFSANILNKLVSMLSNMVITRILTQNDYGIWSYIINIYGYLNLLSGLGLLSGALQFGTENVGHDEEFSYYNYCLKKGLIIDSIIVLICLIIIFFVDLSFNKAKILVQIIAPIILIEYIINLFLAILRSESRIKEYARVLNINTVLLAIGVCCGAFFGVWGVLVGRYCATFISAIHIIIYAKEERYKMKGSDSLKIQEIRMLWYYSIFTGICAILNQASHLIDVSMIARFMANARDVSLYKVSTLIPNALNFIPYSVLIAILPNIISHQKDKMWLKKNIPKIFFAMAGFNFVICFFFYISAPLLISIISGKQYLPSVPSFRVLLVGYFFYGTFSTFGINILASFKCVKYNLFISVVALLGDVFANWVMIPQYGMIGAAYATMIVILIKGFFSMGYLCWILYLRE